VKNYVENNYRVLFTGHSSGGSVAIILAASLAQILKKQNLKPDFEVLSFGSPRPGSVKFSIAVMKIIPKIVRIVNGEDEIPKLPSLWDSFLHAGKKVRIDHCDEAFIINCHHAARYYRKYIQFIGYSKKVPTFSKLGSNK